MHPAIVSILRDMIDDKLHLIPFCAG